MRKALTSLLIVLMTVALVTRTMAAPVLHLHDALAPAATQAAESEHAHSDCAHDMDSVSVGPEIAQAGVHSHGSESPMSSHAKACDNNGACCGPLAVSEAASAVISLPPALESAPLLISAGVKPDSPDRPPSPLLA